MSKNNRKSSEIDDDLDLDDEVAVTTPKKDIDSDEEINIDKHEKEKEEEEKEEEEEEKKEEEEEEKEEEEEEKEEEKEDSNVEIVEKADPKEQEKAELVTDKPISKETVGEDLEDIPLHEETPKQTNDQENIPMPPPRPVRPTKTSPPSQPPRPKSKSGTPSNFSQKAPVPNGENNHLTAQLKDAFPEIPTKVLTAITIASQNNIESCYDACLYYMDPVEFKPTFHPDNFAPKPRTMTNEEQLKQDEILARNLDRKYNSHPAPPPRSRTLRERDARVKHGDIKRGQLPNEYDSDDESEETPMQYFIDKDLPAITQNVSKTFKETSNKVGSWFKSLQSENSNERPFNNKNSSNNKKEVENFKNQLNNSYQYDEWGNPIFEQSKSYKIVEKSPSNDNKVVPQRSPGKTPSRESANKPYINTPSNTVEKSQQHRSVSGNGNKRLVFVEPGEAKETPTLNPRSSVDDDLNLSD
ncbi:hypothetical protein HANVADRAFT_56298 [Hanseniaspora valbyensis NRRL Y-1626]|uniref:CUE domain-containing protein n=1 Tax=Hanseniaspora valbyensis NRRL Y-1626 TaxID=766949 RepID=A0A1B7TD59_9ASCO|nr:hypothetical protein HANVADRAFT_56298 [Hanseniaspora valbyensis NRRL Y-1626]